MLSCSSIQRSNCALARSQCTLSTNIHVSMSVYHLWMSWLTVIHPSSIISYCLTKAPNPWLLSVALPSLFWSKYQCGHMEVLWEELREVRAFWICWVDPQVCITSHTVNPCMLMHSSLYTVNSTPSTSLLLLWLGQSDLCAEEGRLESKIKANLMYGVIDLSEPQLSFLQCKRLDPMWDTPFPSKGWRQQDRNICRVGSVHSRAIRLIFSDGLRGEGCMLFQIHTNGGVWLGRLVIFSIIANW